MTKSSDPKTTVKRRVRKPATTPKKVERVRRPNPQPKVQAPTVSTLDLKSMGTAPGKPTYLNGAIFGPPKTGKTTAAASGSNVLMLSFDPQGDETETLAGRTDITVLKPESFEQTEEIVRALAGGQAKEFGWTTVDSVGLMFKVFDASMGHPIRDAVLNNQDPRRGYLRVGSAVSSIIHDMTMLPVHTIFTAHLQKEDSEDDTVDIEVDLGEAEVKLAVTPMVWSTLGPAVGFIGRTYKQKIWVPDPAGKNKPKIPKTVYKMSLNDGERSPAGSRYKMLAEYEIVPGLMQQLADELTGGK